MMPFDHRGSFEHGLFEWTGDLSPEQTAQIAAAKQIIYAAVVRAIADGVPASAAAVLVDEQFGREILAGARARGLTTACPAEKSGEAEFQFEYGEDFARHIEAMDPTYCKVLVRYNPQGDTALNRRQAGQLRRLSEYLDRTGRGFLFELLVPPEPAQLAQVGHDTTAYDLTLRPSLVVAAIRELQDAGVEPDIWKLEGLERRHDCLAVAETAQRGGRGDVTCIVLGHHAEEVRVRRWLEVAATVPAFVGFAVGRTTFWQPLQDLVANRITRADAVAAIARSYRGWVDTWDRARSVRPSTPGGERSRNEIRLLLADVDGTLVTRAKQLTPRAREAARRLRARGIDLAITSGRPPRGMAMLIEPLGLTTPIAAFNGGMVVEPDLRTIVEQRTLSRAVAEEVVDALLQAGLDVWVYRGDHWFIRDRGAPRVAIEQATVQFEPTVIPDLGAVLDGAVKIVGVSEDHPLVARAEAALRERVGHGASAARSQPYYLDVTHPDANKGTVLRDLARRLDIPCSRIAAIGDMPTDVLMFALAGTSIAMGNASPEVQRCARFVTTSNEDDGFASAVDRIVLGEPRRDRDDAEIADRVRRADAAVARAPDHR
jgi:Cof subfamily protein (haloacid dehalogenase superfamily)